MKFATPEDPPRAPVWEIYIIAQAVQASLGLIPVHALMVGVKVEGTRVQLLFQLSEATAEDIADMDDILDELESLVGQDVDVTSSYEVLDQHRISPYDGFRRIFLVRVAD